MNVILLLVISVGLAFAASCSYAQFDRTGIDSIKRELSQHRAEDTTRVLLLINYAGSLYTAEPDTSLMRYTNEALRIAKTLNWQRGLAAGLRQKGVIYHFLYADPVRAMSYYQQALTISNAINNKTYAYQILVNIGLIHLRLEEYKEGLQYYRQAYAILNTMADKKGEAQLLYAIGQTYYEMKEYDKATDFFKRGLIASEKEGNPLFIANALSGLGVVAIARKEYRGALAYLQRNLAVADTLKSVPVKTVVLMNLAMAYKGLKQYAKAEQYAKTSLTMAKTTSMLDVQQQVWATLGEIYNEKKQYKEALNAYDQYQSIKDSLVTDEKKTAVTRKEMQFEQEKREAVLTAQHTAELKQQQTERNAALGGGGVLLLASVAGFALYKRKREADEQTKEAELKAEIADTEMKALRAQMNPHFIFNSLNSISDYVIKNDQKMADYYLTKFAKLMRLILENSEKKEVLLTDDLQALELYMQLEAMRMQHRFTYEIQVDNAIDPDETLIPPLLLQPFVENSIWHGLARKEEAGKITVRIVKEGDMINCIVEDNGVGRSRVEAAKTNTDAVGRKSLGMKITNARIALINQREQSNAAVALSDLDEGTRVEVRLPLALSFS